VDEYFILEPETLVGPHKAARLKKSEKISIV